MLERTIGLYEIDIYQYSSDVQIISKTYSASTSCPWGSIHLGLDIKLYSNAKVRAAAPGQVINKSIGDRGLVSDRFYINLTIQYNDTTYIEYIFELMSNTYSYATTQLSEISVNIGDLGRRLTGI
jgi:murein DD-endopeptidase MepM/ murein hydrolase activator NlpD